MDRPKISQRPSYYQSELREKPSQAVEFNREALP